MKDNFNQKIDLTGNAPGENTSIQVVFFDWRKRIFVFWYWKEIERYEGYEGWSFWDGENHEFDDSKEDPSDQIFIVSRFGEGFLPCMIITGHYVFDIEGEFIKEVNIFDEVNIQLNTSTGNIIKSICVPFNKITDYSKDILQCKIDIFMYYLEGIDLYLPIVAPNGKGYSIRKWKNVFDLNPDVSNKIKSVTCIPIIENTFIPSSIETKGC